MNPRPHPPFRTVRLTKRVSVRLAAHRCVVVLVPHPDDETLGCGLLIARLVRAGVRVAIVAMTSGDASHPGSRRWPPAALARLRQGELRRAVQRLGARRATVRFMGWHDGRLQDEGEARRIGALCHAMDAGLILASSASDHHPDHKACARIGMEVSRRLGVPLVQYAVWSRLAGATGRRGHDRHRPAKAWAAAAHRSQVGDYISDAPQGFRLSSQNLKQFINEPERYSVATNSFGQNRGGCGNPKNPPALMPKSSGDSGSTF